MSEYGHKVQVFSADWDAAHARIAALEARNAEQFRLMGQYMENAEAAHERADALEARCRAVESAIRKALRDPRIPTEIYEYLLPLRGDCSALETKDV